MISSGTRIQEIHVTKNGSNIYHVLIHPQQRTPTQTRMHSLPRIQTDGPSASRDAEIRLCWRVRIRRRRKGRKIQDTTSGASQRLRKRETQILIYHRRVRKMGKALSALSRRWNTHTHNAQGRTSAQGGARGWSWRTAPRIRLLRG